MHLHDHEAVGGQRGARAWRAGRPCRGPGAQALSHGVAVSEARLSGGQRRLAEARPSLAGLLSASTWGATDGGTRKVISWWTSWWPLRCRGELAGDDERVVGHVGIDEGAVVVVGAARGGVRRVRRRAVHRDGGDRRTVGGGRAGRLAGDGDDGDEEPGGQREGAGAARAPTSTWVGTGIRDAGRAYSCPRSSRSGARGGAGVAMRLLRAPDHRRGSVPPRRAVRGDGEGLVTAGALGPEHRLVGPQEQGGRLPSASWPRRPPRRCR